MSNREIYGKTLVFSVRRLLYDILAMLFLAAACVLGFFIAEKVASKGLIGLGIGGVVGIIAIAIFMRYVSYTYKAGQIAMMTRGVTEGTLPADVLGEGKRVVRQRFVTVAVYFGVTGVIKGIFNEIGRGLTAVGKAVGGDTGETVGSVISGVIQVVVAYLCDCCLGWVFYRASQSAAKATCEGAVIFFKHGKTLARNMGRVFGMGLLSLLIFGGAFGGITYFICSRFPAFFNMLAEEIAEASVRLEMTLPEQVKDPQILMLACAVIVGLLLWSFVHSVFIRPFVLVGVLRNYMDSGIKDIPGEESFALLDKKSKKFAKLHGEATA